MKLKNLGLLGAAAAFLGCLLPFVSASNGFASVSINGSATPDGPIFMVAAAVALVLAPCNNAITDWLAAAAFLAIGIFAAMDLNALSKLLSAARSEDILAQAGPGLYVVIAGAVAGFIGVLTAIGERHNLSLDAPLTVEVTA